MSSPAPDLPPIKEYKSAQYEFNDEQNRSFSALADSMRVTASLMQLVGLAFVVLAAMTTVQAVNAGGASVGAYGPAIGLWSAALCAHVTDAPSTSASAAMLRNVVMSSVMPIPPRALDR